MTIVVCPGGPLLVRGAAALLDTNGQPVPRRRATIALCRCGRTAIGPYCDGSHKRHPERRPGHRNSPSTATEGPWTSR